MSETLTPPPAPPRRRAVRWSADPEKRSVQIGVLGTIVLHLLLLILAPYLMKLSPADSLRSKAAAPAFEVQFVPPEESLAEKPAPTPPPNKFVEANPDAPDNVPDKTNNFSFQNQQVAQEKPTPNGKNDMPALDGKKDIQSTQIVDGQLSKPQEPVPVAPPVEVAQENVTQAAPKQEQIPLSGYEKKMGEDAQSFGSNVAKFAEGAKPVPEKVDGTKDVPLIQSTTTTSTPKLDRNKPQPRPVLAKQQVRPAIFADNQIGTMNIGITGIDAKFSRYGVYLQRLVETVQIQWDNILNQSLIRPPSDTTVSIKFRMDSEGKITAILHVENSSSDLGRASCVRAINEPSPYGKWSDDMVAVLGESQEMTFTFYYQ